MDLRAVLYPVANNPPTTNGARTLMQLSLTSERLKNSKTSKNNKTDKYKWRAYTIGLLTLFDRLWDQKEQYGQRQMTSYSNHARLVSPCIIMRHLVDSLARWNRLRGTLVVQQTQTQWLLSHPAKLVLVRLWDQRYNSQKQWLKSLITETVFSSARGTSSTTDKGKWLACFIAGTKFPSGPFYHLCIARVPTNVCIKSWW